MEYRFDIEQGTTEWHKIKHGVIGGTRAKGLFIKSDTLFYELLAEYIEEFDEDNDDSYQSEAMLRGTELEPEARIELSKYTGIEFVECGFIKNDLPILGISPDGISKDFSIQCEIKCLSAKNHLKVCVTADIPLEYIPQCIHAFTVNTALESIYFISYRPESIKPMFVKELKRDSLVNIGTNARPVSMSVNDCVQIAKTEAVRLDLEIKNTINLLKY